MALQLGAVRDALLDAGASPDKASAAAEELAGYNNWLNSIDTKLAGIVSKLEEFGSRFTILTWAIGINAAATIAILGASCWGH
jgi:hypothetical protein